MDQHNWATKLLGYQFDLLYKPGSENREADALSPMNEDGEFGSMMSNPTWEESSHVAEEVHWIATLPKIIEDLHKDEGSRPGFS